MKKFLYIFSGFCIAALLLCSCADNDSPFRSVIPDEEDCAFMIKPLPMQGEEAPWDSRAVNPMSVDKENMIKKIAVFQFDAENNLRPLRNNAGYYIYCDFTDSEAAGTHYAKKGYSLVTEKEFPALSDALWTNTMSELKTCVIANVSEDIVKATLFPNGTSNQPINWVDFQKASFELVYVTPQEVEDDQNLTGELELGHLHDIYMFGYYEGVVPSQGFTLGLGRTVARMKITFKTDDTKKIDPDGEFYAAVRNLSKTGYYFLNMDARVTESISDAYKLDKSKFDLSNGEAVIQFYSAPVVNENVTDESCTQLLLWYLYTDENGDLPNAPNPSNPEDLAKAVKIRLGNNPKTGDYGIVRNTIYSYTLPLRFYGGGFGIEYNVIFTFDKEPTLPKEFTTWEDKLLLHDGDAGDLTKINDNTFSWAQVAVGDIIRVTYDKESLGTNPQGVFQLRKGKWENIQSAEATNGVFNLSSSTEYFDVEITQDVLDQAKNADNTGGIVISGHDYKATKVEILRAGYASVKPDGDTYTFNMVWQGSNGWQWDVANMHGHGDVPILLDLSVDNRVSGSDFLLDNFLNRSWTAPKPDKYGVMEYVLSSNDSKYPNKKYALKADLDGKKQIQFDFSKLQYAVTKGNDEYIKIVVEGTGANQAIKLIPLKPTTETNEAQFSVTIDSDYDVGYNAETNQAFTVDPRAVKVDVKIAKAFSHVLTPASDLGRIENSDTPIATFIGNKTFTATKAYQGESINSVPGVSYSDLQLRSTDPVTDKDGNAIPATDVEITGGKITFPEDISRTVYLHYDVASTVADTHALNTYQYFDLTLPIQIGPKNYDELVGALFPIDGVDFTTETWGATYDQDHKVLSFTSQYQGMGWKFDNHDLSNFMNKYESLTLEFENTSNIGIQILVNYKTGDGSSTSDYKTSSPLTVTFDQSRKGQIKNIVIQNNAVGSIKIKSITLNYSGTTPPTPTYEGTQLWEESNGGIMTENWSNNIQLAANLFSSAQVRDKVRVYITDVNSDAQGAFKDPDGSWPTISTIDLPVQEHPSYFELEITEDNISNIQSHGLAISGKNYTATHISLIAGSSQGGNEPTPNTLPFAMDETMGDNYYKVPTSTFNNAVVNSVIHAQISNPSSDAYGQFKINNGANWNSCTQLGSQINLNGLTEFTHTIANDSELQALKTSGLAVGGIKYTLSSVTVTNPSSGGGVIEEIWSGTRDITWTEWYLDSSYFNNISGEGDILILTLSNIQNAQIQVFTTDFYRSPTNISETNRLNPLNSIEASKIKENGLGFRGEGCTLIKIEVEHPSTN